MDCQLSDIARVVLSVASCEVLLASLERLPDLREVVGRMRGHLVELLLERP